MRVGKPCRRIHEAEFAMLVLSQLADDVAVPPDVESAFHGPRPPNGSEGGVIAMEHPSVDRTWSVLPSCAVGFPASNSTTNRRPTPAAPAAWSCRR